MNASTKPRNDLELILYTQKGKKLTVKEAKFIACYLESGNATQALKDAGYKRSDGAQYGYKLLNKPYIADEIAFRLKQFEDEKIASATEILQYYTRVMRGEERDQFNLEVSIAERTKAANELAKRQIDIAEKVRAQQEAQAVKEVKLTLDWSRPTDEDITPNVEEEEPIDLGDE